MESDDLDDVFQYTDRENDLWIAVFLRGLADAVMPYFKIPDDEGNVPPLEVQRDLLFKKIDSGGYLPTVSRYVGHEIHQARVWIGSRDYYEVCRLAGFGRKRGEKGVELYKRAITLEAELLEAVRKTTARLL